MPVEVVFQGAGNVTNMTDAAKAQLQAAIQAAEEAGVAKIVVTAGREGGHRSHLPSGGRPGTEWDFYGVNADGTLWSREQRVYAAEGARAAGANRFGFYERSNGQFDPMLHIGAARPGFDQAIWGRNHQYSGASSRSFQNPAERAFTEAAYPKGLDQYPSFPRVAPGPWQGGGTQQAFAPEAGLTPAQQAVSAMAAGGVPLPKAKPSSGASSLPRLQGGGAKTVAQIGADIASRPLQQASIGRGPWSQQEGKGDQGWMRPSNPDLFRGVDAGRQISIGVGSGVSTAAKSVGDTIGKFAGSFNGQSAPTTRAYAPTEQSGPPQNKQQLIERLTNTELRSARAATTEGWGAPRQEFLDWTNDPAGVNGPLAGGVDTELRSADAARSGGWGSRSGAAAVRPATGTGVGYQSWQGGVNPMAAQTPATPSPRSRDYTGPAVLPSAGQPLGANGQPLQIVPPTHGNGNPTVANKDQSRVPGQPNAIDQALLEQQMMRGGQSLPTVPAPQSGGGTQPFTLNDIRNAVRPLGAVSATPQGANGALVGTGSGLPQLPTVQPPAPVQQPRPNIAQGITAGALVQGQLPQLPTTGGATGATMLSRGMKDSEPVAAIQAALNRAGFDSGPTDGDFGPITDRAVRDFQRAKGLEEDGIVGPKTLAAIDKISRLGKGGGDEPKTIRKSDEGSSSSRGGGFDLWGSLTDLFGTGPR